MHVAMNYPDSGSLCINRQTTMHHTLGHSPQALSPQSCQMQAIYNAGGSGHSFETYRLHTLSSKAFSTRWLASQCLPGRPKPAGTTLLPESDTRCIERRHARFHASIRPLCFCGSRRRRSDGTSCLRPASVPGLAGAQRPATRTAVLPCVFVFRALQ